MADSAANFIKNAIAGGPPPAAQSAPSSGGGIKLNSADDHFIEDAIGAQGGAGERSTASRLAGALKNVGTGAVSEADNIFYGPIVMALQAVNPAMAKQLSDKVNQPTAVTAEDPTAPLAYGAGQIGGGTAATTALGAGKLLQGGGAIAQLLKSAGIGGVLGATELKDNPQPIAERVHDAIFGAAGAAAGSTITSTAAAALSKAINSIGIGNFLKTMVQAVGPLAEGDVRLKSRVQGSFDALNRVKQSMFNLRDTTGKEIGDVPADELSQNLADFRARLKGSSVSSRINPVLTKVENHLISNPDDETVAPIMIGGKRLDPKNPLDAAFIDKFKDQLQTGQNKIPDNVNANQVFAALSDVNKAIRTTKDVAARTQLNQLKTILMDQVKTISARAGKNPNALVAQFDQANSFFKDRILPYRKEFGLSDDAAITGDMTAKGVNDWAVKTFESGDPEKIATMMKIAGGNRGKQDLTRVFMNRALQNAVTRDGTFSPAQVMQYFNKNKVAVKALPPDIQTSILGFSKMLGKAQHDFHDMHGVGNWMTLFGAYDIARGEVGHGVHMMAIGLGAKLALRSFNALFGSARGAAILAAASKLPEDSPRLALLAQRAAPLIGSITGGQTGTSVGNFSP